MSHVASSKLNPKCPEVLQNIPSAPEVLQIALECYRIVQGLRRVCMTDVTSSKLNPKCPEVLQNIPRTPEVLQIASECYRIVQVPRRLLPNAKKCYGSPLKRLEMLENNFKCSKTLQSILRSTITILFNLLFIILQNNESWFAKDCQICFCVNGTVTCELQKCSPTNSLRCPDVSIVLKTYHGSNILMLRCMNLFITRVTILCTSDVQLLIFVVVVVVGCLSFRQQII